MDSSVCCVPLHCLEVCESPSFFFFYAEFVVKNIGYMMDLIVIVTIGGQPTSNHRVSVVVCKPLFYLLLQDQGESS